MICWKPHGSCLRPWLPHPSIHPAPLQPASPCVPISIFMVHILSSLLSSLPTHFGNSGTVWPPRLSPSPPSTPSFFSGLWDCHLAPSASQQNPSELAGLHQNPGLLAISKTNGPGCGQIVHAIRLCPLACPSLNPLRPRPPAWPRSSAPFSSTGTSVANPSSGPTSSRSLLYVLRAVF